MSKTLALPKKNAEPVYMDAVQRALAEEAAMNGGANTVVNAPPAKQDQKPDPIQSPAEDHPKHATAYMVTKTFTISSPITMSFKQGKVITSPTIIANLLAGKAPIVKIDNESMAALITCPECSHIFKP